MNAHLAAEVAPHMDGGLGPAYHSLSPDHAPSVDPCAAAHPLTPNHRLKTYPNKSGISSGCRATFTLAASSALILSAARPEPPSMMAPA